MALVFLKGVKLGLNGSSSLQKNNTSGAPGGVWPSSPEISSAMLERYKKQNGNGYEPKP